jgi:hypothetical protein
MGHEWLIGKKIKNVRPMTDEEAKAEDWYGNYMGTVLEVEGGGKIYASSDPEGNGPGQMYGVKPDGTYVYI